MSISDELRGVLTNWLSMESVCVGILGISTWTCSLQKAFTCTFNAIRTNTDV